MMKGLSLTSLIIWFKVYNLFIHVNLTKYYSVKLITTCKLICSFLSHSDVNVCVKNKQQYKLTEIQLCIYIKIYLPFWMLIYTTKYSYIQWRILRKYTLVHLKDIIKVLMLWKYKRFWEWFSLLENY